MAYVFPLKKSTNATVIKVGENRPLIVFNPELDDPTSLINTCQFVIGSILHTLAKMDVDVAILATPTTV